MRTQILALVGLCLIAFSCNNTQKGSSADSMLYTSAGSTSELLVVTHKTWYEGIIGDTIKATLGEVSEWLMKEEPLYDITKISPKTFEGTYQKHRNILVITRGDNLKEPKIEIKKDVWASPQIIVKIFINDESQFAAIYSKYLPQIKKLFYDNEIKRIQSTFEVNYVKTIALKLKEKFGFSLHVPKGFVVAMDTTDFMWMRKEAKDVEFGLLIYTYPYTDTKQFNQENVISKRNELTKKFIPGPIKESFMKVSSVFPPYCINTTFKDNYATLLRTWWDLEAYPMGGPFLSYTFYDEASKKMIVLDSYIYAPKKDKRDYLLQLEAIFDTFNKN